MRLEVMREFGYTHEQYDQLTPFEAHELFVYLNSINPGTMALSHYFGHLLSMVHNAMCKTPVGPDHYIPWLKQDIPEHLLTPEEREARIDAKQRQLADDFESFCKELSNANNDPA
ncbi:hypothetical protein ACEUA8_01455 [Aeromonas veronii]